MSETNSVERRVRRRLPEVGMWLRIQERHDEGGAPLIRVERIDARGWVFVTDWNDFDREAPRQKLGCGYTPARERCFAFDADDFSRRSLRYWKRVKPSNVGVQAAPVGVGLERRVRPAVNEGTGDETQRHGR